jgi:hypothetical protein
MAFKMKGNPYKMGTMATKSTMMKAEESAMKMKKESAMKKYASDAQRRAVHASKAESAMKMGRKSPVKKGHEDPKEGSYTTHGKPSKYTTSSGKSVSSANIDEGNLSTVKTGSDGRKFVTVQDDTAKFKAGTKLYIGSSATKMKKGSAMKLSEADKEKAMENAMPAAEKKVFSRETMDLAKSRGLLKKDGTFNTEKARNDLGRLRNMSHPTDSNLKNQAEIRKLMKAFTPRTNRNYSG